MSPISESERSFYIESWQKLLNYLRLRDSPVAIKILRDTREIPKASGVRRPRQPLTACQLVNLARVHEEAIVALEEDVFCSYAAVFLGYINPEDVKDVFDGIRDGGWGRATVEAYKHALDELLPYRVPYGTKATIYAPITKTPIEPDIILIHCNPAQAGLLINAYTWWTGERITFRTGSENGTCGEAIAVTYTTKRFNIAFPCYGTRRTGLADDDQLIVSMTTSELKDIIRALEEMRKPGRGRQYPIRQNVEIALPPPINIILRRQPPPSGIPPEQWRSPPPPPPIP